MKQFYLTLSLLAGLLLLCAGVRAQTVIAQQSFENSSSDNWTYTSDPGVYSESGGSDAWIDRTSVGSSPDDIDAGSEGSRFFIMRDLVNGGSGGPDNHELTFSSVDISNYSSVSVRFDFNIYNFDAADAFGYEVFVDGTSAGAVDLLDLLGATTNYSTGNVYLEASTIIPDVATSVSLVFFALCDVGTEWAAVDLFQVIGTEITGTCDISATENDLLFTCTELTTGTSDGAGAILAYSGVEPSATASINNGGTILATSDDPGTDENGKIRIGNLTEGGSYTLTIAGGSCSNGDEISIDFMVPSDLCTPSALIVNEYLASPTDEEFVELVNSGATPIDLTGYTFEDRAGNPQPLPAETLQAGEGIVLWMTSQAASLSGCYSAVIPATTLNDDGDDLVVRNASGQVITLETYTAAQVTSGISQARTPDRDPAGTFAPHNTIADGSNSSPCQENGNTAIGLPVELLRLGAVAGAKQVVISWSTTNEVNNAHFEVQRSTDLETWSTLGSVAAAAVAARQGENQYAFTDRVPLEGDNYYRLRQMDHDGTATVYGPVSARFRGGSPGLYPNPVGNDLYLSQLPDAADRLYLLGADGRVLRHLPAGSNHIPVGELAPGIYFLRIDGSSSPEVLRFVKR